MIAAMRLFFLKFGLTFISFCLLLTGISAQDTHDNYVYESPSIKAIPFTCDFEKFLFNQLYARDTSLSLLERKIKLAIIIEKDGLISSVEIQRDEKSKIDSLIERIILESPKWLPAKNWNGEVIRAKQTYQITPSEPVVKDSLICMIPDSAARFNGDFDVFIKDNMQYPEGAASARITGKVVVYFMVEKDGSISNICYPKRAGFGLDEEAKRLMELMPKWIPAYKNGNPVRTCQMRKIVFRIQH